MVPAPNNIEKMPPQASFKNTRPKHIPQKIIRDHFAYSVERPKIAVCRNPNPGNIRQQDPKHCDTSRTRPGITHSFRLRLAGAARSTLPLVDGMSVSFGYSDSYSLSSQITKLFHKFISQKYILPFLINPSSRS